jgi:hypothetical protein
LWKTAATVSLSHLRVEAYLTPAKGRKKGTLGFLFLTYALWRYLTRAKKRVCPLGWNFYLFIKKSYSLRSSMGVFWLRVIHPKPYFNQLN